VLGTPVTVKPPVQSGIGVTAFAHSWTAGVTTVTRGGTLTSRRTGLDALTAGGAGQLVLVTATTLHSSITDPFPIFGTLTLNYVPEPAPLSLAVLALAAAAAWAGQRVGRRR
jgi:hypothetical protein